MCVFLSSKVTKIPPNRQIRNCYVNFSALCCISLGKVWGKFGRMENSFYICDDRPKRSTNKIYLSISPIISM